MDSKDQIILNSFIIYSELLQIEVVAKKKGFVRWIVQGGLGGPRLDYDDLSVSFKIWLL